jgi:tryptophan 2,3-dioxygenase
MDYGRYLELDQLLSAQHPRSVPAHHDEMLFIVQHQTSELWMKLMLHELRGARTFLDEDDPGRARKSLARVKTVLRTMTEQWSVLSTLTPSEYAEFRGTLGTASGFQSAQYRAIEFILGNKRAALLAAFEGNSASHAVLSELLQTPSVYDAFLRYLARMGHAIPAAVLSRDVSEAWSERTELIPVFKRIYDETGAYWEEYAVCEDLVDLEDAFQLWRFRHLRTVQRTIGFKAGTGGSSGVSFLKGALELTFFPELFSVRTEIGT